ncbi:hypothetical protein DNH61_13245 [Paenibacillus sambharensis]|uniref:Uncharacterized protein n=1 Tax=Paenibacillus sambharensis TaxID=1803190 RepID=A0A2W1L9A8_9BACL|nr:hypothetical protein [Paenibacillus sambharensis]PZD95493.1 hypothetical protein DNH61_13245 [Paenibacillus sambharensis]
MTSASNERGRASIRGERSFNPGTSTFAVPQPPQPATGGIINPGTASVTPPPGGMGPAVPPNSFYGSWPFAPWLGWLGWLPAPGGNPSPGPYPLPPESPASYITVVINGGAAFPWITQPYSVRYRPGLTVYQALAETGIVRFSWNGQLISVGGVYTGAGSGVSYSIRLNGQPLPPALLSTTVPPGASIGLTLLA